MNIRALLVTSCAVLLLGCGPESDILQDWTGTYVVLDPYGYADRGCRVVGEGDERQLIVWQYEADGAIAEASHPIRNFELIDQYSQNYGTRQPTWIYHYRTQEGGPEFLIHEYFDGNLEAQLSPGGEAGTLPLKRVDGVPPILRLQEQDIPAKLATLRELVGRHFWIDGRVLGAERQERDGRLTFGASDIFKAGFIDEVELESREVGAWQIFPILRTPLVAEERGRETRLPSPGNRVAALVRLIEVREKAHSEGHGVLLSFRYRPEG